MNDVTPTTRLPQQEIASIRRNKFRLDNDGRLIDSNPLTGDLHNSIEHLSEGLYSRDIHFVMELIQNAEDNTYLPGIQPELIFRLLPEDPTNTPGAHGALLVVNNESGLRFQDIEALCSVGKSTKTKRQGYIGEKGIGFKSVFKVSRRPHLFSAGYQFYFDRNPDPAARLGYIIPYWVDGVPDEVARYSGKTCILLPLDEGQFQSVINQLSSIAPEIILFLSRLEGLTIEIPDRSLQIVVDKCKRPLVDLLCDSDLTTYWIYQREVNCPSHIREEKRFDVRTRVISIAFPLEGTKRPAYSVFAYLPTEMKSGYPFLINADFLLTSSREEILQDRPWNRWLRDEISPCFVEAFTELMRDKRYGRQAYRFIPLEKNVQTPFFQPPVKAIHEELANRPVVWVIGKEEPVEPKYARLAPKMFHDLLDDNRSLPLQLTQTMLVPPELDRFNEQLRAIGVKILQWDEVCACLRDKAWLENRSPHWFVKLYEYLRKERTLGSLNNLPIIPATHGRLVSVGEEKVYLPEAKAQEIVQDHGTLLGELAVTFLDAELYHLLEQKPELLDWVRKYLAGPWTEESYCSDLITAINKKVGHLSTPNLVRATRLVRDLLVRIPKEKWRGLCALLPFRLEDGGIATINNCNYCIVTPSNLDLETGWQVVFPEPAERVGLKILSSCYLNDCSDEQERQCWRDFFGGLGLTDTPIPQRDWRWGPWQAIPADLPKFLRSQLQEFPRSTGYYYLRDVQPPRWLEQGDAAAFTRERVCAFVRWLEKAYKSVPKTIDLIYFYRSDKCQTLSSEFYNLLQQTPWFPTTKGFHPPSEVFLGKPEIREIFGDMVPYPDVELSPELAEWLGMRASATFNDVLTFLEQLAQRRAVEVHCDLVTRIYKFLWIRCQDNPQYIFDQRRSFTEQALIYVSNPTPRWVSRNDVIWVDRSDVFGSDFAYLEREYPQELRKFFVDQIAIKYDVDDEMYVRSWLKLQQSSDPDPVRVEMAMERIFPVLKRVAEQKCDQPWWREFLLQAKVWTQENRFVEPKHVFVPDDSELKRIFGKAGIHFVWRPKKDSFADYHALYEVLRVRSLLETTRCELCRSDTNEVVYSGKEIYLTSIVKRGICLYLWSNHKEEFERLKVSGVLSDVLGAREVMIAQLILRYRLDRIEIVNHDALVYFDRSRCLFFYSQSVQAEELEIEVAIHIARTLAKGDVARGLEDFIRMMFGKSEQYLQRLVERHDWRLPLEEQRWVEQAIAASRETEDAVPIGSLVAPGIVSSGDSETRNTPTSPTNSETVLREVEPDSYSVHNGAEPQSIHEHTKDRSIGSNETRPISAGSSPDSHKHRSRISVYPEPERRVSDSNRWRVIEEASLAAVEEYERKRGRRTVRHDHYHPGWDIDSFEPPFQYDTSPDRRIEVKAVEGAWNDWGVALTPTQYRAALQHPENYYLYVVEYALDEVRRKIYVFRNPAAKVAEYRFAQNWRDYADESE